MPRLADHSNIMAIVDRLMLPFHAENGLAPINIDKTLAWVTRMVEGERVLLALRGGEIVGGLGMHEAPLPYADASLLIDQFYYVRREWRGESVGGELERKFKEIALAAGLIPVIRVFNPGRALRRGRVSQIFGLLPFGYEIRLA